MWASFILDSVFMLKTSAQGMANWAAQSLRKSNARYSCASDITHKWGLILFRISTTTSIRLNL